MDPIKDAFQKVRQDIESLYSELGFLRQSLFETRIELGKVSEILLKMAKNIQNSQQNQASQNPAQNRQKQTIPTHKPTNQHIINKGNQRFSTGNEGVPTDRQTNQQTDRHMEKPIFLPKIVEKTQENTIEDAARMLESLDSLKKEIRLKFKQLTDQEIFVFATLWQLEDEIQGQGGSQGKGIEYKALATKLGLTESSIRDYIGKLIKKGIPVDKTRIRNKQIVLSISENLKKIASLPTILQLRDL